MARIPLFPLNTVLFPRMPLPLRIFEKRYKLMINRCVDERAPFGVLLIRSGEEVGGPAEPHTIGTTARIARLQRLDEGRMNLITVGERRFRIEQIDDSEPYLMGDVAFLESQEAGSPDAGEHARRVATLFGEQFRLAMAVSGQWARAVDPPSDPDRLADYIAHQIEATATEQQELLETLSVPERLRREAELLGERIRALSARWEEQRRQKFAGAALN